MNSWVTIQFVLYISQWTIGNYSQSADFNQIYITTSARILLQLWMSHGTMSGALVTFRYVVTAAFSLSTTSHPSESEIRLSQLILLMRNSCWQAFIYLLVSMCLEIIQVILVFFFSWVLNLLVSYLFCLTCRRWLRRQQIQTSHLEKPCAKCELPVIKHRDTKGSQESGGRNVLTKRNYFISVWEIMMQISLIQKRDFRLAWENSEQFELQVWRVV